MPTFGSSDIIQDQSGNALANVQVKLYASLADAKSQSNLLATAITNSKGQWPISISGYDMVWVRDPAGSVWSVPSDTVAGDHAARLAALESVTGSGGGYAPATGSSVYETQAHAAATYAPATGSTVYETQTHAAATYAPATGSTVYEAQTHAASTYEAQAHAVSTYETQTHASATYETQTHASATYAPATGSGVYETQAHAASTYETQTHASATYQTSAGLDSSVASLVNTASSTRSALDGRYAGGNTVPTMGEVHATASQALGSTVQDLPGTTLTFTPTVAGKLLVIGSFDITCADAAGTVTGYLNVDGTALTPVAVRAGWSGRAMLTRHWVVPLTAAAHTIKLQAQCTGSTSENTWGTNTGFSYQFVPGAL
jgi:hypothetical protein